MPLLVVPPSSTIFDIVDRVTNMVDVASDDFQPKFYEFCEFVVDSEELFRLMESAYTSVTMVLWGQKMHSLSDMYNCWMMQHERWRLGAAHVPSSDQDTPQSPQQQHDVSVVLLSLKLLQCIRGIDRLQFPASLITHPDPTVRYYLIAASSTGSLQLGPDSAEMSEVRRVAVNGNSDLATGVPFPPLVELVKEFERHVSINPPDVAPPQALVSQIMWSRLRFQMICLYGHRMGRFCTQHVVEENPSFFTEELMRLCAFAPSMAASSNELVCGILSDLFAVFELGFLDFSLFPTPEVLQQNWKNVQRIFDPDLHATFRSHGIMAYGVLRALQYSGGFLTRHEPATIAKVKLAILRNTTIDDPVGRFAFTISQSLDDYLGSGLFETIVHLLHKFVRSLLQSSDEHEQRQSSERLYLKFLRLNVIANIVEYIFNAAPGHPAVSPVFFLSHRMGTADTPEHELLPEMICLFLRFPEYFGIALHLTSWCGKQNPRDVTHRLVDLDVIGKLNAVFSEDCIGRLKLIKLDNDDGAVHAVVGELCLRLISDGLSDHADAKAYVKKFPHFIARALCTDPLRYRRWLESYASSEACDDGMRTAIVRSSSDLIEPVVDNVLILAQLVALVESGGQQQYSLGFQNTAVGAACELPEYVREQVLPKLVIAVDNSDIGKLVEVLRTHSTSSLMSTVYLPAVIQKMASMSTDALLAVLLTKNDHPFFSPPTLMASLLTIRYRRQLIDEHADQLQSLWDIVETTLRQAELDNDEMIRTLDYVFREIRKGNVSADETTPILYLRQVDAYVLEWANRIFFLGLENMVAEQQLKVQTKNQQQLAEELPGDPLGGEKPADQQNTVANNAIAKCFQSFLTSLARSSSTWDFNAMRTGAFGDGFFNTALTHPKLRECGAVWHVVKYASISLDETAGKIKEIKSRLEASPPNDHTGTRKSSRKRSRNRTGGHLSSRPDRHLHMLMEGADCQETPQAPLTDEEREKLVNLVSELESHYLQILNRLEPLVCNDVISHTCKSFMNVNFGCTSLEVDPFRLASSIDALDEDLKSAVLSAFHQKFLGSDDILRNASIPVASVVFVMFDHIPQAGMEVYRRLMSAILPDLQRKLSEGSFESTLTVSHLLQVLSIMLCFVHYHAWKEDHEHHEKELPAERLHRIRNTAAWQDELAIATLVKTVVNLALQRQQKRRSVTSSEEGASSPERADEVEEGLDLLLKSVVGTIATLSPKLYTSEISSVWLEAHQLARSFHKMAEFNPPDVSLLFVERTPLLIGLYRWTSRRVFQRLRNAPAAAEFHLKVDLKDVDFAVAGDAKLALVSSDAYALDADVFFAEMKRCLELDVDATCDAFMKFVHEELVQFNIPSSTDPSVLRCFVILVSPTSCEDLLSVEELEAVKETVDTLWPRSSLVDEGGRAIHHGALCSLALIPKKNWPTALFVAPGDESSSLQRSVLPFAEDLVDQSFCLLESILELVPSVAAETTFTHLTANLDKSSPESGDKELPKLQQQFDTLLARYREHYDHIFRSINSNFVSFYIQETLSYNIILNRTLTALRELPNVFMGPSGMRHGLDTIIYLLRLWTSGPLQVRNAEPKLMLDALANPVDEELEEDDDGFSSDEDEDEDAIGEDESDIAANETSASANAPVAESATTDETIAETLCNGLTKQFLLIIPDITVALRVAEHVKPPPMQAAQPDSSPYHFFPPPRTQADLEALVFRCMDVSIEQYVVSLAAFLTENDRLRGEVFINIAVVSTPSFETRLRIVSALLARLYDDGPALKSTIILNACLSLSASVLTGMRRTFEGRVLEPRSENSVRFELLNLLLGSLSKVSSFFRQKIVSLLMRIVTQTHLAEPDSIESTWGKELPADSCFISYHPDHELFYLSVGDTDAACCLCREVSAFYHYGCPTCRKFSCCLGCKLRFTNPAEDCVVLRNVETRVSIDRVLIVLEQSSDSGLSSLLGSLFVLVAQPSFPCERSDGAMLLVDAIFRAASQRKSVLVRLARLAFETILPTTASMLDVRRSRLQSISAAISDTLAPRTLADSPVVDDSQLLQYLAQADFSHDECDAACYLHHFIPIVLERLAENSETIMAGEVQRVLQQMIDVVILTLSTLAPVVSRLKSRDVPFSSSPANAIFFAVTARSIAALGPAVGFDISDPSECIGMSRSISLVSRTETQLIAPPSSNDPSTIFKQVVPKFNDRVQQEAHLASQQLSTIAVRHRVLINFYLRNSESPYQILDAGLSSLLDVSHLDFAVRERLFRSRLEEQAIEQIEEIELPIQRGQLLETSFLALMRLREVLKKGIVDVKLHFDEEDAVDEGGVTREWITLFFQELIKDGRALRRVGDCYEINPSSFDESKGLKVRQAFESLGIAVGLALSRGIAIEPHFTRALYRHMIGRQPTLADLEFSDPELFRSLMTVSRMTMDEEFDALCQFFTIVGDDNKEVELMPGGSQRQVSNSNKKEYIKLLAEHVMTNRVHTRVKSFLVGISRWFPLTWLTTFSADEMELVCCGMAEVDVEDWRTHTRYEGYTSSSPQVRWFWDLVEVMAPEDRARLLQFTRGSSKVPAAGFVALVPPFTVSSTGEDDVRLPSSHTCYNQLEIPKYSSAEILRDKLYCALEFGTIGFGFA